jgi:hypothetical protein
MGTESSNLPRASCKPCDASSKWAYTPTVVEVYKSETSKIIDRFLHHRPKLANCIDALDAALARLIPRLTFEQKERPR